MVDIAPHSRGNAPLRVITLNAGMGISDREAKPLVCPASLAVEALATVLLTHVDGPTVIALQEMDFAKKALGSEELRRTASTDPQRERTLRISYLASLPLRSSQAQGPPIRDRSDRQRSGEEAPELGS